MAKYKQITLVVSPAQYDLFKAAQARLSADSGFRVSLSQTLIRALVRQVNKHEVA